jgi:hypothetical protein
MQCSQSIRELEVGAQLSTAHGYIREWRHIILGESRIRRSKSENSREDNSVN